LGREESDAKCINVRGVKGAESKTLKRRGVGNGEGVSASPPDYEVWGNIVSSPSGVRSGALAENGCQCFQSVTECISMRCLS